MVCLHSVNIDRGWGMGGGSKRLGQGTGLGSLPQVLDSGEPTGAG